MKRKILISPGYGAGWVTWAQGPKELKQRMLTHEGLVRAVEAGEPLVEENAEGGLQPVHPALIALLEEIRERWPEEELPFLGGVSQLVCEEVEGEVRLQEYDGYESYITREQDQWGWL